MAKMLVALAVVMMHGVMAKRSSNWLDDTKHLSVREQSEEEPSMDENQVDVIIKSLEGRDGFQDVWDRDLSERRVIKIIKKPLDVTASAVAFCGELFKEVQTEVPATGSGLSQKKERDRKVPKALQKKSMAAEDLCPKVLTGSLGAADPNATEWEKKAAKVAQLDGKEHDFGRLSNVPWRESLHRVCHDECHALVQGIHDKAALMQKDFERLEKSLEEICADNVVREVESEIMTCCARSCGWNGRSCMYWPFMNFKQQADWESECCVEMNILNGSTRERLCDSTLSKHDKEESYAIIDNRSNTAKDREIIGQDGDLNVSSGSSFMEKSSMRSFNGTCPKPLDLDQLHKEWKTDWKVMNLTDLLAGKVPRGKKKVSTCVTQTQQRQASIDGCTVFLLLEPLAETSTTSNEEKQRTYDYRCLDHCDMPKPPPKKMHDIDANSLSPNSIVYVHKDTNWTFPKSTS